jgi:transposase
MRGDSEDKIAVEKGVSKSTVTKLWSLYRTSGSYHPRANLRGRKPALSEAQLAQLRETIVERPDITLSEMREQLGLVLSVPALSKIVRFKLGLHYKKNSTPSRTTTR